MDTKVSHLADHQFLYAAEVEPNETRACDSWLIRAHIYYTPGPLMQEKNNGRNLRHSMLGDISLHMEVFIFLLHFFIIFRFYFVAYVKVVKIQRFTTFYQD